MSTTRRVRSLSGTITLAILIGGPGLVGQPAEARGGHGGSGHAGPGHACPAATPGHVASHGGGYGSGSAYASGGSQGNYQDYLYHVAGYDHTGIRPPAAASRPSAYDAYLRHLAGYDHVPGLR